MKRVAAKDVDAYIVEFPSDVRTKLEQIRAAITKAAPRATEKISYAIPTFYLNGNLVHFAAFKNHIGLYPGASGIKHFAKELSAYKGAKGSVQFPLDEPLPLRLVTQIVKFRVAENTEKKTAVRKKKAGTKKKRRVSSSGIVGMAVVTARAD